MPLQKPIVCVLGCGTMGVAIISEESAKKVKGVFGDKVTVLCGANLAAVREADVVLLCTKPQVAKHVLTEDGIYDALQNKLLISILAGLTIDQIKAWVPASTKIIRAMPNTPCMIRQGMTVLSCPSNVEEDEKAFAYWVFATLGRTKFLDEKHLDTVTGLSGSGPAFACVVLEALADGGVMMGLPRQAALELAAQALKGTAEMVLMTGLHPAAIKDSVTTPAGCTIAGLLTMEDGKIRSTLARAVEEAAKVASTLGKSQKK
ncbi:1995_t:CDS:2 [Paraglomus brasilianum]|uniref:Pyrroline-5-carboxylate reductase n=1 Tax=Paraglomus brasilianum TaxID=144538 RepID=A0A9N9C0M4_9GLOM|nr:1995_t:CDS:2 [Paraglomus brasilianum]